MDNDFPSRFSKTSPGAEEEVSEPAVVADKAPAPNGQDADASGGDTTTTITTTSGDMGKAEGEKEDKKKELVKVSYYRIYTKQIICMLMYQRNGRILRFIITP